MNKIKPRLIFPIFIPHRGCPFRCIFCDQYRIANVPPQLIPPRKGISHPLENEQVAAAKFIAKHDGLDKEIAFYGGSFTFLSEVEMQSYFNDIKGCFDKKTFFRISTRPDGISEKILLFLKENRVNTIELGIQSFSDNELETCQRGYDAITAITACHLVKSMGFNLSVQLLIGLPGANQDSYAVSMQQLREIKPDFVRLYPLLVLKGTQLEVMYKAGLFQPLSVEEAAIICAKFLKVCKENNIDIAKIGLHGDLKRDTIVAGPFNENFGEMVYGLDFAWDIIERHDSLDTLTVSNKILSQLNAYNKYAMNILKERFEGLNIIQPLHHKG